MAKFKLPDSVYYAEITGRVLKKSGWLKMSDGTKIVKSKTYQCIVNLDEKSIIPFNIKKSNH